MVRIDLVNESVDAGDVDYFFDVEFYAVETVGFHSVAEEVVVC